jgi:acetolactate synthase I/II/III large subunit
VTADANQAVGGKIIADWIEHRGITHFFNVPGESFLPVLDALRDKRSIRTVTNRHEAGAAYAAEAYGKITQRPAVCMATRGPGASNLTIGVQTAFYDGTPMIALVGMVPTTAQGKRAFQDFDLPMMFGSIAKKAFMVSGVSALQRDLDRAYEIALEGRPGPVVVGLPTDIIYGTSRASEFAEGPTALAPSGSTEIVAAERVVEMLTRAKRPVLLVATEAARGSTAAALGEFSLRTGLPVYAAWRRYSSFDNGHPHFVGSLGLGGSQLVSGSLAEADLVVTFGFGLEQITIQAGGFDRAGLRVVQMAPRVDADGAKHASLADVVQLEGSPEDVARCLVDWCEAEPQAAADMYERLGDATKDLATRANARETPGLRPGKAHLDVLMHQLNRVLQPNAIVTSDAGNFAHWLLRYVKYDRSRSYVGPVNGSMGYGLPAAIGAELAAPDRPCWCVAGDGGMLMLAGEMETAARLGLNTAAIVVNNKSYGTIRAKQETEFPGRVAGTDVGEVDFAKLGQSFGWQTWKVTRDTEIGPALSAVAGATGCRLIEVLVDQPPFGLT